jgi:hypothetical protein
MYKGWLPHKRAIGLRQIDGVLLKRIGPLMFGQASIIN